MQTLHAVKVEAVQKDGRTVFEPVAGSEFQLKADLVLLAMGFVGPEKGALLNDLGVDLTARGMGVRAQRFSMLVDNGVVKSLNVEAPGKFEVSDAQTMLKQLG